MQTNPDRRFQVSLVPMLEQRTAKHTLNSVLKILKTGTLFTVFSTKSTPFHYVLSLYFTPNHSVIFILSDLRKPTLFQLKSLILNVDSAAHCPAWKKSTLSHCFLFSIGTKSTSKRNLPPKKNKCISPSIMYAHHAGLPYMYTFYVYKLWYIPACKHTYAATKMRKFRHTCMSHWKSRIWVPSWSVTSAGHQSSLS